MKRVLFVWTFDKAKTIYPFWRDGLRRALEILDTKYHVDIAMGQDYKIASKDYDAVLIWADSNEETIDYFADWKTRKGIILTTNPDNVENLRKYNIVFCESKPVLRESRSVGLNAIQAFGTDTAFYKPTGRDKDIPFFYPATFSPWKLQRNIAYLKDSLVCVGTVQPDGQEDLQKCLDAGVQVRIGYYSPKVIHEYYDRCKEVLVPAIHGSERTVLEAMSMDMLPVVSIINGKAYSFVSEFINSHFESPRAFVKQKYSAERYARRLEEGLRLL